MSYLLFFPVFFLSALLTLVFFRFPIRSLLDTSNERSLHTGLTPRSGGIAIVISFIGGCLLFGNILSELLTLPLIISFFLLLIVSLIDDFRSLHQGFRLLVQVVVAAIIVFKGDIYFVPEYISSDFPALDIVFRLISVVGLVWLINLYNFMDGMDGFASGMALIGFGALAFIAYLSGDEVFLILNLLIVVSVSGFWIFNFPPAKIFMGDSGATLLGCLAGVSGLLGVDRGLFPLWVPVVLFSPFWVDASYTVIRRMIRGEPFWQAHRSHFYQRLVLQGLSHRQVVLYEYGLMLLCATSVLLPLITGVDYNPYPPMIWGGLYLLLIAQLEANLKPTL